MSKGKRRLFQSLLTLEPDFQEFLITDILLEFPPGDAFWNAQEGMVAYFQNYLENKPHQ